MCDKDKIDMDMDEVNVDLNDILRVEEDLTNSIFEYFDVGDLFSCRLVCKQWNELVIPKLQEKVSIVFEISEKKFKKREIWLDEMDRIQMANPDDLMEEDEEEDNGVANANTKPVVEINDGDTFAEDLPAGYWVKSTTEAAKARYILIEEICDGKIDRDLEKEKTHEGPDGEELIGDGDSDEEDWTSCSDSGTNSKSGDSDCESDEDLKLKAADDRHTRAFIHFREDGDGDATLSKLPEYYEYLENNPGLIFSNVTFRDLVIKESMVESYIDKFGHQIRKLTLDIGTQECNKYAHTGFEDPDAEDEFEDEFDPRGKDFMNSANFRDMLVKLENLEELNLQALPQNVIIKGFRRKGDTFQSKIKKLHLYQESWKMSPNSKFLLDLFISCPLLEGAYHHSDYDSEFEDFKFLSALLQSQSQCLTSSLRELSLQDVDQIIIKALVESNSKSKLRLTVLKFHHLCVVGAYQEFQKLMESQAETLESFIVVRWSKNSLREYADVELPPPITFPVMPKLKLLRIGLPTYSETVSFACVNWLVGFPSLRKLILHGCGYNCRNIDGFLGAVYPGCEDTDHSDHPPHLGVTGLELPSNIKYQQMKEVGRLFPNVNDLVVGYQKEESFSLMCKMWPKLESLFMCVSPASYTNNDDSLRLDTLFTGFSPRQCRLLIRQRERGTRMRRKKQKNPTSIEVRTPSIASLKELKQLTVHPGPHKNTINFSGEASVTDASVYFGFAKLPKLEYISIWQHQISVDGINALCDAIPNMAFNLNRAPSFQCQKDFSGTYKPHPIYNLDRVITK